ncbi:MAG: Glu/Leu/Phe/Val dehydrogenase dimerization domain-containing protein [Alphaproteobacteria bacterium]
MPLFEHSEFDDHETVVHCTDSASGLRAIIAIHDSRLGPALGGCRMWPYADEAAALTDVLRLSRGMTYKSALAGLSFGGGKSVIIGDPRSQKTPALMAAMGRAVERLGGGYIVAEDVGIGTADVVAMARETAHVAGLPDQGGDPSPATAFGVYQGIRASVAFRLRRNGLDGVRVAVQGLGQVGRSLCDRLAADGAQLVVADLNPQALERAADMHRATVVAPDAVHAQAVDVFAPCALGAVVNDETIGQIQAPVVAGSANNQLAAARHGTALMERDILYAPDYVINAGGIINIAHEPWHTGRPYSRDAAFADVARIHDTLLEIFGEARAAGIATEAAANRLAERRLAAA